MQRCRGVTGRLSMREHLPDLLTSPRPPQVVDAYLKPAVDHDEQPCRWERPDLHGLREFCSVHFNWPQAKADEHLLPVMQARRRW